MLLWAVDNPAPANYLLISGDRDFSNALHQLRMRRYNVLLALPFQASSVLVAAANSVWRWTSLVDGFPPLTDMDSPQSRSDKCKNKLGKLSVQKSNNGVGGKKRKTREEVNTQNCKRPRRDSQTNAARNFKGNMRKLENNQRQNSQQKKDKAKLDRCGKCPTNHRARDCQGPQCYNCGKFGHMKNECDSQPAGQKNTQNPLNKSNFSDKKDDNIFNASENNFQENLNTSAKNGQGDGQNINGNQAQLEQGVNPLFIAANNAINERAKKTRTYSCRRCPLNHPGKDCQGNKVQCNYCGKLGHRKYECYKHLRDQIQSNQVGNISNATENNVQSNGGSCANNGKCDQPSIEQEGNHEITPSSIATDKATHEGATNQGINPAQCHNSWEFEHLKHSCGKQPMNHQNQLVHDHDDYQVGGPIVVTNQQNQPMYAPVEHGGYHNGANNNDQVGGPIVMNQDQASTSETLSSNGVLWGALSLLQRCNFIGSRQM
ncbi:unnamed protein product [Amaranthus hypochondriacus]